MNITTLINQFIDYKQIMQGVTEDSAAKYRMQVEFFINHHRVTNVSDITQKMVVDYFVNGRVERKWKPSTFHTYLMSLHVFFKWCVAEGHMKQDFTESMQKPKIPKALPKSLSKEQAQALLTTVYNYPHPSAFLQLRNYAIFATFIFAGLRKTELLALQVADIDLYNRTIFVRSGKGGKDRVIPIGNTLEDILRKYLTSRGRLKVACGDLFISSKGDNGLTSLGLKYIVGRIRKASQIKFTLHVLRHTFATLMYEGGCDILAISQMLGHSDIKTTMIYVSASTRHLKVEAMKHPLDFDRTHTAVLSLNHGHQVPCSCGISEQGQVNQVLCHNELAQRRSSVWY